MRRDTDTRAGDRARWTDGLGTEFAVEFLAELVPPLVWAALLCVAAVLLPVWGVVAGLRRVLSGDRGEAG